MRWLVAVFLSLAAVAVVESTYYCQWKHWGAWSVCSAKCGQGKQYRYRQCDMQTYCQGCQGDDKEYRLCYGRAKGKTKWVKTGGCYSCQQRYECRYKDSSCTGIAKCGKNQQTEEYRTCASCCSCEWKYSNKYKGKCTMRYGQCMIEKKRKCTCKPKDCPANCNKREPKQYAACPYPYSDSRNTCPPPIRECRCYWKPKSSYSKCYRVNGGCYKKQYQYCYCPRGNEGCSCNGVDYKLVSCRPAYGGNSDDDDRRRRRSDDSEGYYDGCGKYAYASDSDD